MDWFLYDTDHRYERVKLRHLNLSSKITMGLKKYILLYGLGITM